MRNAALTCLVFVASVYAVNAQLSLTPKTGIENSHTSLKYNDQKCFSPLGSVFSPQAALRLDYKFKKTHGPFVEIAANRSVVAYRFTDPETGGVNYTASRGNTAFRFATGYMVSSKKIMLGKSKAAVQPAKQQTNSVRKHCGGYSSLGRYGNYAKPAQVNATRNKAMHLRIQPYAGAAFVPNPVTAINSTAKSNETIYTYNAGNWNTALFTGADLEFGRGNKRLFVVGFQYLKGLGNVNTETLHATSSTKATTTNLRSNVSAWNVMVGLPFTLSKSKSVKQPAIKKQEEVKKQESKSKCEQYRKSCGSRYL